MSFVDAFLLSLVSLCYVINAQGVCSWNIPGLSNVFSLDPAFGQPIQCQSNQQIYKYTPCTDINLCNSMDYCVSIEIEYIISNQFRWTRNGFS